MVSQKLILQTKQKTGLIVCNSLTLGEEATTPVPLQNLMCIARPGAAVHTFPHLWQGYLLFFPLICSLIITPVPLQNFTWIASPPAAVQTFPHL